MGAVVMVELPLVEPIAMVMFYNNDNVQMPDWGQSVGF